MSDDANQPFQFAIRRILFITFCIAIVIAIPIIGESLATGMLIVVSLMALLFLAQLPLILLAKRWLKTTESE